MTEQEAAQAAERCWSRHLPSGDKSGGAGKWSGGNLWVSLHSEVKKREEGDCENPLKIIDSFCKQSPLTLRPGGAYLWKGFEKNERWFLNSVKPY